MSSPAASQRCLPSYQRRVGGVVGRLPLQHGLRLLGTHAVEVPGGQPFVGDHLHHAEVRGGAQVGGDGSHLDKKKKRKKKSCDATPTIRTTLMAPGTVLVVKRLAMRSLSEELRKVAAGTDQEEVLFIALHGDHQAERGGGDLVRAAEQVEEGGGVEDAVHLHTQTQAQAHAHTESELH